MARKRKADDKIDPASAAFQLGLEIARKHPICRALLMRMSIVRNDRSVCPRDGWAVVCQSGAIHVHPSRKGEPKEWAFVIGHCAMHLAFGHFDKDRADDRLWQAACDVVIERFLTSLKLGELPFPAIGLPGGNEHSLYRSFKANGLPAEIAARGLGGSGADMVYDGEPRPDYYYGKPDYEKILASGLTSAVEEAVVVAAGYTPKNAPAVTIAERARRWFISSYPLLGAMAAGFKIVEEPRLCQQLDIAVAAVDPSRGEIFMNPAAAMNDQECRFVIAHEILHVGLRHVERCEGRDPFLWNVACDFVINGWLLEMGIGQMPSFGGLYDPELKGMNAEAIYDLIVRDIRRYRKLATCRGVDLCDVLGPSDLGRAASEDLDDFYRRALAQGLTMHQQKGRGLLPAGLIEEIEALSVPPIPWDVKLAQWLDGFFSPFEPRRTYARPSRRQSTTPDIPRPRVVALPEDAMERTFGVVLDTSGSMEPRVLAQGLGAIASFALSREVPFVRLVFCDATTYDEGYVAPEAIAGRVKVRGRGGTVLQPGIDLLERAPDFPKDGPILIVTDGLCDRVRVAREHAFLMPPSARLPFPTHAPIFEMENP